MYRLYIKLGRVTYGVVLPLMRLLMKRTRRAYVVLYADGKVLVVKNWLGKGTWALPGGGIGRSESPEEAVVRELHEELHIALDAKELVPVSEGRWRTNRLGHYYYIFTVHHFTDNIRRHKLEITDARWLPIGELGPGDAPLEIVKALQKLSVQ